MKHRIGAATWGPSPFPSTGGSIGEGLGSVAWGFGTVPFALLGNLFDCSIDLTGRYHCEIRVQIEIWMELLPATLFSWLVSIAMRRCGRCCRRSAVSRALSSGSVGTPCRSARCARWQAPARVFSRPSSWSWSRRDFWWRSHSIHVIDVNMSSPTTSSAGDPFGSRGSRSRSAHALQRRLVILRG